ncbi:DUF4167 domain-containing protein [Brevundimonas bacteroides]|uniref:DUF4167 domain-containing protein n=1 Tax=Brevundimonas bacteroides TaxID=74311 RepID=UPI000495DF13|nr:DUF4167 domain-containing protein [Brevundimonas bacteroides]
MRDFKGMKRQRGRNRKPGGGNANAANPNRSWDSQGPENIKVRGNAQTVYERYQQLARDAASSGDRVLAENYLQHAEHYFRVLRALQPQRPVSEIAARELSNQGFDIDFEDETGAQAAAFLAAAQQQAEREARQQAEAEQRENREPREPREWRDRDQNRDQNREWQPREPREGEPRADGEGRPEGGRRETRRERWERRREERNRRFQAEGGVGEAPEDHSRTEHADEAFDDASATAQAPAETVEIEAQSTEERPVRRTRAARREEPTSDDAGTLPGFLTRSAAPGPATTDGEIPAPKKRASRARKVEPAEE